MKPLAPCGHRGEPVIGAYVRCLRGCPADPFVQPRPQAARKRGEPGHVDFCGCKPCTLRRWAKGIELRTKAGDAILIPWDGVTDLMYWNADHFGTLRHWSLLDEDGKPLAKGTCNVDFGPGDPIRIDIATMIPPRLEVRGYDKGIRHYAGLKSATLLPILAEGGSGPPVGIAPVGLTPRQVDNLRQAAKKFNFSEHVARPALMLHDEIIFEHPEHMAHDAVTRMSEIMFETSLAIATLARYLQK